MSTPSRDPAPALASAWRGLDYACEVMGAQPGSTPANARADVEKALAAINPKLITQLRRDPWSI